MMPKHALRCLLAVLFAASLGCGRERPAADPKVRAPVASESLIFVSASYDLERKRMRVEVRNEGNRLISLVGGSIEVTGVDETVRARKRVYPSISLGGSPEHSPALLFHGDRGIFIYDVDRYRIKTHSGVFLSPRCGIDIYANLDFLSGWSDAPNSFRIETEVVVGLMHWPDGSLDAQEPARYIRVRAEPFVVNLAPTADAVEP